LGVILAALFIFGSAASLGLTADDASAKAQAMRQTGKQIFEIGYEQYQRGMHDQAKVTLQKAAAYRDYLSASDVSKLDELLGELDSQSSPQEVNQVAPPNIVTELLSQARNFAAQGEYLQAKQKYMQVKQSGLLSSQELAAVDAELAALDQTFTADQTQTQSSTVNPDYIKFVSVDANDINNTEQVSMPVEQPQVDQEFIVPVPQVEANDAVIESEPVQVPQELAKENYIEVVKQKQRIQQSYTKAVVNEAIAKAKDYADKQDFAKARDEISRASAVVEKNKLLLGDDYTQYTATLQQLLTEVGTRQSETELQKAEKAKTEAQASQEKLRAQQAADKQKRIQDLLTHAQEYQEQQRYDEALAQMDTLLAIDPQNREAARNKQMLEDIINLRTQLEIKREIGKQEEAVLTDTQRSMIPHADLYTYPRNWQDIAAKRKPEIISGLPSVDVAVYKQLETIVDLSALTPDTPLNEAIEIIKTSVEPPLKIIVRWKDLADNAYIEQDTVIGMQGFTGIPVGKALKEVLNTVSGGIANIDFAVEEGVMTIATRESLPGKLIPNVYDITDLIAPPVNFESQMQLPSGGGGGGGLSGGGGQAEDTSTDSEEKATILAQTIQDAVSPESWLINGGQGTVTIYGINGLGIYRLVISQTPQIHDQIKEFMKELRKTSSQQVSIEARFLFVTENFLEDIGLDTNLFIRPFGKFGAMIFEQGSYEFSAPSSTTVPGSLGGIASAIDLVGGGTYGSIMDDLSVSFFLRATQAHRDAKMLTAPRVTVLSGERASIVVAKESAYISDYEFEDITANADFAAIRTIANPTTEIVADGVTLDVTPRISDDKKYVDLVIVANYSKVDLDKQYPVYSNTTGDQYNIQLPVAEISEVQTHVSVPDGGTLLIGGQKLSAEVNREAGVPGFSKMPIIGRLFSNRSKIKDQDVLLILVKPTIMLQNEAEREYFAPLEEK
jgi:Flp pilus assembly secretin CpaC/tetratricopeptide (TPR) repeat protein